MIFQSARIKLTAWYVAIIIVISLCFSAFVYRQVMAEVSRGFRLRSLRGTPTDISNNFFVVRDDQTGALQIFPSDDDLFEQIRSHVLLQLAFVNGFIFISSSLAGYFLAGKTLRPIESVMEDQRRFIGDASHELRTPLTSLKTEIEVSLRDKKLTLIEAKKLLDSNLEEVNKIQTLSNYLLTLSRYENGEKKLPKSIVQLNKVADRVVEKFVRVSSEKGLHFENVIDTVKIRANETSIEELLSLLIDNAIKYSPKNGKIEVLISSDKHHAILKVSDNGIGIKASDMPYIFNRFYRADSARAKQNVDGYGLGLSIAKSIVEMHKGKIEVQSEPGKGSIFTVSLPK